MHGTVKPNMEKVLCIQNCRRPSTKKQVRSLMGLVGYYRKFIPNCSAISAPLTNQTKKVTRKGKMEPGTRVCFPDAYQFAQ